MKSLIIDGQNLKIDDVVAVSDGRSVALSPGAVPAMVRSRRAVEKLVKEGEVAYGITTGFGRFKDRLIAPEDVRKLQLNLVRSHACGVGQDLEERTVRAMLLVRANTLSAGYSGVRPQLVELLLEMINAGVHPQIPSKGSLGASGDLAPLAHLALVLIGEGKAHLHGELLDGAQAMRRAGLKPLVLEAKEGLALTNGTTLMVGLGALLVRRAVDLAHTAEIAACLSLEALNGTDQAFDERVHAVRPHPRQIDCAAFLRKLLAGSRLVQRDNPRNVQDPYTLRCVPQVHGAVRDAIAYARWVIDIELNAVNDNPLIFTDEQDHVEVISAGNFHGEPIALATDYLKLAITDLGNMSERRTARLMDADSNGHVLPMFLTPHGGLESGFMIAQYSAAALATENKVLAHPASADSIPSSANTEDHVSMGATSVLHLENVLTNAETIVAIELLSAAQGIDFRRQNLIARDRDLGRGTAVAFELIRREVPFLEKDVPLSQPIEKIRQLVAEGTIKQAVEEALDEKERF
jgi:histidine ammonia-lyase